MTTNPPFRATEGVACITNDHICQLYLCGIYFHNKYSTPRDQDCPRFSRKTNQQFLAAFV